MAAKQKAYDEGIVWESPETPVTADDFIFQNGKRFVKPYFFEFIAHVKERWAMKTVANLFAEEFRQRPLQYYVHAINSGRILVDGKLVTDEFVVRVSQTLSHFVHRHEPPVMANPVAILEVDADVVTVCKPFSVPVHPCGQYRKNTVVGILQAEHNFGPLYPIHRLDRLVSGLLILARNAHTADCFRQEIEAGAVQKIYVARVLGVFPDEEVELNTAIIYNAREGRSTVEEAVNLPQEIQSKSPEKGSQEEILNQTLSKGNKIQSHTGKGKQACTRFQRLHTDGVYSIVKCMPLTGRTHQIRVHLQHLGHPIANDALYAVCNPPSRSEKGANAEQAARGKNIRTDDKMTGGSLMPDPMLIKSNFKRKRPGSDCVHSSQQVVNHLDVHGDQLLSINCLEVREERDFCHEAVQGDMTSQTSLSGISSEAKGVQFMADPMCTHCPNLSSSGYEEDEHGLWLHCKSYSGRGWKYECPLPNWAEAPPT